MPTREAAMNARMNLCMRLVSPSAHAASGAAFFGTSGRCGNAGSTPACPRIFATLSVGCAPIDSQ